MWDWIISVAIILGLILTIWARISNQTVGELLRDIKDIITDSSEKKEALIYYEWNNRRRSTRINKAV